MLRKLPDYFPYQNQFVIPGILCGPLNPLFFRNRGYIQEMIKKFNLEKLKFPQTREAVQEIEFTPPWWKYGGPVFPHLHLDGDAYLLNDEQWKAFSDKVMNGLKERIGKAGSVNFSQISALADAAEMF